MTGNQLLEFIGIGLFFLIAGIILPAAVFTAVRFLRPADEDFERLTGSQRALFKIGCYIFGLVFLLVIGVRYEWDGNKPVNLILVAGFVSGGLSFIYGAAVDMVASLMSFRIPKAKSSPIMSGIIIVSMGGGLLALPYIAEILGQLFGVCNVGECGWLNK